MKKIIACFCVLFTFLSVQAQNSSNAEKAIHLVLEKQVTAWNAGNVEEYMQGYWNSDSLTFIGKSGVTKGWQATLDRYKKSYPDAAAMGKLDFELLELRKLSDDHCLVIGKWHLQRTSDELKGLFSLIFKRINKQWVIIADHSS